MDAGPFVGVCPAFVVAGAIVEVCVAVAGPVVETGVVGTGEGLAGKGAAVAAIVVCPVVIEAAGVLAGLTGELSLHPASSASQKLTKMIFLQLFILHLSYHPIFNILLQIFIPMIV